jgi:hypothetical protein
MMPSRHNFWTVGQLPICSEGGQTSQHKRVYGFTGREKSSSPQFTLQQDAHPVKH